MNITQSQYMYLFIYWMFNIKYKEYKKLIIFASWGYI